MNKYDLIDALSNDEEVWYFDGSIKPVKNKIIAVNPKTATLPAKRAGHTVKVPHGWIANTIEELYDANCIRMVVSNESDAIKAAQRFGLTVASREDYKSYFSECNRSIPTFLDVADSDDALSIEKMLSLTPKVCKKIGIEVSKRPLENIVNILNRVMKKGRTPEIGEIWVIGKAEHIIAEIDGLKAVRINDGSTVSCSSEYFKDNAFFGRIP